eukprot:CAMPEP_0184489778 /NCGR_PEP_ID=MMETSP0113_2-20130426/16349_1 /TAXON_ID=91329 /ORGANISM="Norrisiella sphaerica, Strain BC52" /LENGTH=109 /DNA_ID=CAMNT_0026873383 /DNA_START=558 /DNA_END=887 /DNA_ORIENTATION=-
MEEGRDVLEKESVGSVPNRGIRIGEAKLALFKVFLESEYLFQGVRNFLDPHTGPEFVEEHEERALLSLGEPAPSVLIHPINWFTDEHAKGVEVILVPDRIVTVEMVEPP